MDDFHNSLNQNGITCSFDPGIITHNNVDYSEIETELAQDEG